MDKNTASCGCQLKIISSSMEECSTTLGVFDKVALYSRRVLSALLRRLPVDKSVKSYKENETPLLNVQVGSLKEGDYVFVRSMDEISAALKDGKTRGLVFMPAMSKYCGGQYKVLKVMRYMFDERNSQMRKCNSIILEGVICDGKGQFDKEGCDRCCFFFWKEEWLKKRGD